MHLCMAMGWGERVRGDIWNGNHPTGRVGRDHVQLQKTRL